MTIFHIIFLWLGAGLLIKNRYQYPYLVISFIILFLISGFRTLSVGTDTYNYLSYFQYLANYGVDSKEIGWGIVNKVVISFGGGFNYVLVLSSILAIAPIFYVASKSKYNSSLVIFSFYAMGFYTYSLNIVRQIIAVSFVALAMHFIKDYKKKMFLLFVCIASTFHIMALLVLPLYFINYIPDDKKKIFFIYIFSVVIASFVKIPIAYVLAPYLNKASYLDNTDVSSDLGLLLFTYHLLFLFVLLTVKYVDVTVKIFMAFVVFYIAISGFPYSNRILMFYDVGLILLVPQYIYNNKFSNNIIPTLIVLSFLLLLFSIRFGGGDILPYYNTLYN